MAPSTPEVWRRPPTPLLRDLQGTARRPGPRRPGRGDSVSQKSPGSVQPAAPRRPLVAHVSATPVPGGPRGTIRAEGMLVMAAASSASVSGAGTPVAGPAGRDLFAEGLLEFLRPAVQQLDSHVHAVRESQVELREQIDNLASGAGREPCGVRCSFLPSPRTVPDQ
ncbi:SNARE-associated protein Snapin isoform X2 [Lutra lutra]|uniref:SNARE-associated protein Snapin isoform X2 n=1 Tax=Lutra lutra TaxID=9657 RepID=UPI001FD2BF33|nr:SNARE-associated protein Snapin isoform X2 [Lutra lutra]